MPESSMLNVRLVSAALWMRQDPDLSAQALFPHRCVTRPRLLQMRVTGLGPCRTGEVLNCDQLISIPV